MMRKTFRSSPANPYKKQLQLLARLRRQDPLRLFGVERYFLIGLATMSLVLPAMFVRFVGGKHSYLGRKAAVELWTLGQPALLLAILKIGWSHSVWAVLLSSLLLVDMYVYLLGLVFLHRFYAAPVSYGRSVLLLGVNLLESVLGFAVLYLYWGALTEGGLVVESWSKAVYFSVITAATIGYGDILPGSPVGRLIIVLQAFSSLLFVTVIVTTFVGNLWSVHDRRSNTRLHPTAAVREQAGLSHLSGRRG